MNGPLMGRVEHGQRSEAVQAWQQARRILCIRLDNLGDVLMTSPALRALKVSQPDRHLSLLCSSRGQQAAHGIVEIDAVIPYRAPWVSAPEPVASGAAEDRRILSVLRNGEFDAAVIFTVYSQSPLPAATLCRMAGIPRVLAHCRENPYGLISDWLPESEPQLKIRHEVQRQLDLVASVGASSRDTRLSYRVDEPARQAIVERLRGLGVDPAGRWVLIHPGATAASRRYPPRHYAHAADRMIRQLGCAVVFNGTADEQALIEAVRGDMRLPSVSLAGSTDLNQSAALIEAAQVLVANNSGAVHIAAAVGTPVVDLYALTNPQHTPWQVPHRLLNHDVPCRNCYKSVCPEGHHNCLRMVAPQRVADAVAELCAEFPRQLPHLAVTVRQPSPRRQAAAVLLQGVTA